jgi:hypothetical protein
MSFDSRYALAAQSYGYVFLSVLPRSQIRIISKLSAHAVSFYVNGDLLEFTTSQTTSIPFLNPNVRHVFAIETVFFNSFAVVVDSLPCRASQWKCTIASTVPSEWKHPDFDDSLWALGTPTSFVASGSSVPSLSDIHQSSQWVGLASGSESVAESILKRVSSPKIAVYDNFQSNILNSDFWTHLPSTGASFQVGAGSLVLSRKPIIRSSSRLDFSLYPISISGTFKFDSSQDFFQIYTRSDGTIFDSSREVNGLRFFFGTGAWPEGQASQFISDSNGNQQLNPLYVAPLDRLTMSISMRVSDSEFTGPVARKNQSSWRALVGTTYSFRITDNGSFAQVFINDTLQLSLTNISHSSALGSYVAFFNKEDSERLTLGPITIAVNSAASESRLFCRSATSVFRGGRTFAAISSLPLASWVDVAVSASGLIQIAAATNRLLQLSSDGGITWGSVVFPSTFSTNLNWCCVSVSGDGAVVVAATRYSFIFVSRNGVWVQSRIVASWKSIAASHDGSRIVAAADNNGGIFFTTNFGKIWNQNLGIRYLGKDWTSVSISSDGLSLIAASSWVAEVKRIIPYFFYNLVVLNSTCQFFSPVYYAEHLSGKSPNFVQQYSLYDVNPAPSSGIDTFLIKFSCSKVSGSVVHGIVTSLADSEPERRLFCSSDVSGESWKSPDFDDFAWQPPSILNLSSVTVSSANPNVSHIAKFWIENRPSYISSDSQILWAPDPAASSFSCRYKLPAYELANRDWMHGFSGRHPNSPNPALISDLWRNATVSERGTTWSAPTPLGYTTDSALACDGENVGSDLFEAQLACEKCIECHSILRIGTNPGVFSLRQGTNVISDFQQVTQNHFSNDGAFSHLPTSYLYRTVSEYNYESNVWFLGRQTGVAESHDFGRTWFARSSQRRWSSAVISADGSTILACSSGKLLKTHSFNHIQVSLSFSSIPSNASGVSNFSVSGSVLRGVGIVSQHSGIVTANSYVFIPHAALNAFTVMFWLQTSSTCAASTWQSGCAILVASAFSRSFSIHIASGNLYFSLGSPSVASVAIKSSSTVNDTKWHFIAVSWNASSGAMSLYIDGELSNVGDSSLRDSSVNTYAHTIQLGGSAFFAGSFDDFRVFSVAYESETVENVFNRSTQLSIPYGASTKSSFNPIDDDLWESAVGSCLDQPKSAAISSDGTHIIALLQPASSSPSIFDFNANRRLEPFDCVDVDECALGTHSCSSNQTCFNTQGSHVCNCSPGFSRFGDVCIDVNECVISSPCGFSQNCINTIGSFTCVCKEGYGNDGCADINECGATIFPCPYKSICTNTIGSFTCACPNGTVLNGSACVDVDECASGAHNCGTRSCVNSFGSFKCVCSICSSKVFGTITSLFTGRSVMSAEIFVLSHDSNELIASSYITPSDNGTYAVTVPMNALANTQYRLLVRSFLNAELVVPFLVAANEETVNVNVSVFQHCEALLAASASAEYSGCINVDPNMFIAIPSSVSISKYIFLFGAQFPYMSCEARLGINITSDPDSYVVAQSCSVTSSMTARVLARNTTDSFVPLQMQLLFRSSAQSIVSEVLTSPFGIVTLLNGTAHMQSLSPATG